MAATKKHNGYYFSVLLILALGSFTIWMISPYLKAIFGGLIFACIFFPVFKLLEKFTHRKRLSAFITILLLIVVVLLPLSTIATGIALEISQYITEIPSLFNLQEAELTVQTLTGFDIALQQTFIDATTSLGKTAISASASIFEESAKAILKFVIVLLVTFFIFTDNEAILKKVLSYLPFSQKNSHYLLAHSSEIIRAILVGQGLSASLQASIIWITFALLQIPGAAFWGFSVLILAFLPIVGATLIWVPATILLLIEGDFQSGLILALVGGLLISSIENFLKPLLMKGYTTIHPFTLILGIFAGLSTLGFVGLFIGPIILALFLTVVEIYYRER